MSKVSEKCKSTVLSLIRDSKSNFGYKTISKLSDVLDAYPEVGFYYSGYTLDKAIAALLKEGRLIKNDEGYIGTPPKKEESTVSNSTCGVTKEQILKAAETSPEAKKALESLFPDMFDIGLLEFSGGTKSESFVRELDSFNKKHNLSMLVANGLAPNAQLKMKTITVSDHRGFPPRGISFVVFDATGKQVYKSKPGNRVFFGFEKVSK